MGNTKRLAMALIVSLAMGTSVVRSADPQSDVEKVLQAVTNILTEKRKALQADTKNMDELLTAARAGDTEAAATFKTYRAREDALRSHFKEILGKFHHEAGAAWLAKNARRAASDMAFREEMQQASANGSNEAIYTLEVAKRVFPTEWEAALAAEKTLGNNPREVQRRQRLMQLKEQKKTIEMEIAELERQRY